jgi:CHAD domain-containing protein
MPVDQKRLLKPFRKLRKNLKAFPKQPSPGLVHDVRTSSRRIEATLAALALDSKPTVRQLLRRMRSVRKQAGKVRDLDVLTGFASHLDVDEEQECAVQLLEFLGAQRYKKAAKMHTVVRRKSPALRRGLRSCSEQVERFALQGESQRPNDTVRTDVIGLALRLSSELRKPPRLNRSNLHPYRLRVKQLQYVLQIAADGSLEHQRFIEKLKEVKDAIGEWHDWQELLSMAGDVLNHGSDCKLLREIKLVGDQKFQHALAVTHGMRQQYLNLGRNGEVKSKRLPERVLAVASAAA